MNLFFRDIRWEKLIYLTNFKNEKFSSTYFTCFIYFRDLFDRTHFFFNMFGSDCKMAFTEQTHFEVLFEYRNVPQTHQQTGGGKNTESVIHCRSPAKRGLFYTSRCSPVFSSPHQQKIKCCWNPDPFQKGCHYYLPTLRASRSAHVVHSRLAFTHLPVHISPRMGGEVVRKGEKNRGQVKEMKREKMKARGGDDKCRCMLGETEHRNEMFSKSNDWSTGLTDGFKCLQPGECVKDIQFPCLGKIGFNVYTGLLCSKGIRGCMSLCTFRG